MKTKAKRSVKKNQLRSAPPQEPVKAEAPVAPPLKSPKRRILIVDDHAIVREGLAQLINSEADLAVCGEVDSAQRAIDAINALKPDIAIVDISLSSMNGIELIKNIKVQHPTLPILVLSMHDESLYAERALRAGAKGYIMKQEGTENLRLAIRQVLNGEIYLSTRMSGKMLTQLAGGSKDLGSPIERMSDRELEVFQLIGQGLGTRQIAEKLHLSIKTIESYREHIKQKMNFKNGTELVQQAVQWVERSNTF
jgi:DNA-binding NarL/FixJ family response regulator